MKNRFAGAFGRPAHAIATLALTALFTVPALSAAPASGQPVPGRPAVAQDDANQAELWIDTRDHSFGTVLQGEVLDHTFEMMNSGSADLVITQAKPTCGCTVSNVLVEAQDGQFVEYSYGDPVAPGTKLRLSAQLNTKNKSSVAKSKINVFSNDERGLIQLSLHADITTYFRVSPQSVNFGDLTMGDSAEMIVEVTGQRGEPFTLEVPAKTFPPGLTVDLEPVDAGADGKAKRWRAKIAYGEGKRDGRLGYPLQLKSDQAIKGAPLDAAGEAPTYMTTVMINANVKGLITFQPAYLSFGLLRPGQLASRSVSIEANDPEFELAEPKITLQGFREETFEYADYFTWTVRPVEGSQAMDIELSLTGFPEDVDGSFQGKMVIETGHPMHPEFTVAFSGVVRGGVQRTPPK